MKQLPKHLGGHANITHKDESTLHFLISNFNIKSFCDVGCGPGGMVTMAESKGLKSIGIDGDFTLNYPSQSIIIVHDFTTGPLEVRGQDLCWCCEFLEHVEEKYMDNYFSVFKNSKYVFCTFSLSRGGHHHVNVKDQQYWDEEFRKRHFIKDIESTEKIRQISSMSRDFVRLTGTLYINKNIAI